MNPAHLERLCEEFELGTPVSSEENHEGVLNRNYDLVTSTGRYFIKLVRDRRKDAIPVIAAAESFMRDGGVPAVGMQRTRSGDLYCVYGEDVYTVYPYIEHTKPQSLPDAAMGEMLARIHVRGAEELPVELRDTAMVEKPLERVVTKLRAYRDRAQEDTSTYREQFLEYIDTKFSMLEKLPPSDWQHRVLAHGDYHDRNILFDEQGTIIGICDWEKAELVPRGYEIARSIQYICFRGRDTWTGYTPAEAVEKSRSFLAAYRAISPITEDELRAGFTLRLRKLVMSFWIEERFYDHADERANQFIEHETHLIRDFADGQVVEAIIT